MNVMAKCCVIVCISLLAANCTSVPSRIKERAAAFHGLSAADQELVARGKIREGMGKEAVYIAWGKPDEISHGNSAGRDFETWLYFAYEPETAYDYDVVPRRI